jgi:hypothetical protein
MEIESLSPFLRTVVSPRCQGCQQCLVPEGREELTVFRFGFGKFCSVGAFRAFTRWAAKDAELTLFVQLSSSSSSRFQRRLMSCLRSEEAFWGPILKIQSFHRVQRSVVFSNVWVGNETESVIRKIGAESALLTRKSGFVARTGAGPRTL